MARKSIKITNTRRSLSAILPWILVIGGIIGFLASFILTVEKIELLKDPNFQPSCNLSPILSCGSVMITDQAEAFSFPNPFLGLAGFSVLITVGMAMFAGATFKRWFWQGLQAGVTFAILFIHWLMYQSLYNIGALCPYCMIVWIVVIPIFWYVTLYNLRERNIVLPNSLDKAVAFAQKHHADILIAWYVIILLLILNRFWYYWSTIL